MLKYLAQASRHYLLALQFFTRVPVTGALAQWVGFNPAMLRASAAHFPGVGWLVGAVVAGVSWLLLEYLPRAPGGVSGYAPLVAAVWSTAVGVLLTGAFHEDGLADVADGLGGSPDRARALLIMKDSRVGAFGAMAIVLVLLAKMSVLALLGSLSTTLLCAALFAAHVVSRTWPLLTIRLLPHVGDEAGSKSKPLADQISGADLWVAWMWCLSALALTLYAQASVDLMAMGGAIAVALVASGLAWVLMWRWFAARLQGFTGDCLGATQQVCELAFYLGLCLAWS
jgi:adenosylcobinamide-GDP ribazoletransferase